MGENSAEKQWVIDLEELQSINSEIEIEKRKKHCIYRVPNIMRELNDTAYTPQLVSLGPYHHGKAHLKPMERNKHAALAHYLERANKTLDEVREAVRPQIRDLMDAYDSLEEPWTDEDRFLDLMILDGCFFLEMMVWGNDELWRRYMNRGLWMDMRRIENQLPLLLPVILIETGGHEVEDSKNFIKTCDEVPDTELKTIRGKGRHLLDISKRKMTAVGNYIHDRDLTVRTATELFQAGVSFKQADSICYSDISFTNGVLKLPHLYCHSNTENMFLNYTAYEHIHKGTHSAVSNYVLFMDNIIDTDKDVALLREANVMSCTTGSDGEIASLFNRLTKGLPLLDKIHVHSENVNMKIENYCNRRWHKWRAIFIQTYLSNPWVIISLLAAFVLLVLTVIQTTYTIMPFYKSS